MKPRPPHRLILTTPVHFWAFGFGSGLAPVAPGTFGSLVGLVVFALVGWLPRELFWAVVVLGFLFGLYICGASARMLRVHDDPGIVWDEIVGILIALIPLNMGVQDMFGVLPAWAWALITFVWFRVFDIIKPWPIRWIDRHVGGGTGIMLDDALAGVYAGLLSVLTGWPVVWISGLFD
ncbi:phosphatidylglycerophosphatase A [uncultured Abyssibacter sp.]|uniref:phosphatidylglycerophosphatase A family protein n=1 Tax=uncultured Abyssibacter sp. TaxID=2320202 RepID=UPI0032B2B06E